MVPKLKAFDPIALGSGRPVRKTYGSSESWHQAESSPCGRRCAGRAMVLGLGDVCDTSTC